MGIAFEHVAYDVDLLPDSGTVGIVMQVTVRGEAAPTSELVLLLDGGMLVSAADVGGTPVSPVATPAGSFVNVSVPITLAVGEVATVTIAYGGVPLCDTYAPGFAFCEGIPAGMSRFQSGSVFPILLESDGSPTTDVGTQLMALRVPSGTSLVSNYDVTSETDDGSVRTLDLAIGEPRAIFTVLLPGVFEIDPLSASPPVSTLAYAGEPPAWESTALEAGAELVAFIEASSGVPFPCDVLTFLALEPEHRDVSFSYRCILGAHPGDVPSDWRFEEYAAHELSHQIWGIALAPSDSLRTKLLHDGAAQLAMYDWAHARRFASVPYDEYLGFRHREADIMLRYLAPLAEATPVLVPTVGESIDVATHGATEAWGWQYLKSSAAHDGLRILVGDQLLPGRTAFLSSCIGSPCVTADYRDALEEASGLDLGPFFDAFVTDAYVPDIRISFAVTESAGGFTTTIELQQNEPRPIPIELLFELEDGELARSIVEIDQLTNELTFEHAKRPIVVRPNPRLTPLLRDTSAVEGDVNFDGRSDGIDLVRCNFAYERQAQAAYPPALEENLGFFGVDLFFDPRCDFDADGVISDADLSYLRSIVEGGEQ